MVSGLQHVTFLFLRLPLLAPTADFFQTQFLSLCRLSIFFKRSYFQMKHILSEAPAGEGNDDK